MWHINAMKLEEFGLIERNTQLKGLGTLISMQFSFFLFLPLCYHMLFFFHCVDTLQLLWNISSAYDTKKACQHVENIASRVPKTGPWQPLFFRCFPPQIHLIIWSNLGTPVLNHSLKNRRPNGCARINPKRYLCSWKKLSSICATDWSSKSLNQMWSHTGMLMN